MNFDQFVRGTFDIVSPSPPNMGVHPLIEAHGNETALQLFQKMSELDIFKSKIYNYTDCVKNLHNYGAPFWSVH